MNRTRPRWTLPLGVAVLAAAGVGAALASGTAAADPARDTAPVAGAEPQQGAYGYGPSSLTDCFDDQGVPYRQEDTAEGRALTPLGSNDPRIATRTDRCSAVTTRPASEDATEYGNAVSRVIIDCLRERGYELETDADTDTDELTDGEGRSVITWRTVPDHELAQTSQAYRDDSDACTAYAESQVPSPAPQPAD